MDGWMDDAASLLLLLCIGEHAANKSINW